jgi:GntR family transcriptional regulator, rspAB operon transcriptional repressor
VPTTVLEIMTLNDATASAGTSRSRRQPTAFTARPSRRATTTASVVYRDLREEIVSLRRKPEEPISEKQIAEAYGISRTPVREAVLRLADEGLIEVFPQSGTFVARIPLAVLPEAIAVRRVLEEAVMRHAAAKVTRAQLAQLNACLERQREMVAAADQDGFHQCDKEFHALLADIAGYPGFWALILQSNIQVDRFRRLTLPVEGRMSVVVAEHEAIVAAIADRDPDRAARALVAHLDDMQQAIADARRDHPQYFQGTDGSSP